MLLIVITSKNGCRFLLKQDLSPEQVHGRPNVHGFGVKSITYDNGKEFAAHERVAEALGVEIFFADPHFSWQRGANESTNGLIRQYFPKNTPLNKLPQEHSRVVEDKLNNRSRKILGYLTPNEVLFEMICIVFVT